METNNTIPGKGAATASLVLGIVSVVLWFVGHYFCDFIAVVLGIIGLVLAGNAKKSGFKGGIRTAGFVLSLIGILGGVIILIVGTALANILDILAAFA